MGTTSESTRIVELDGLRGLAILLVLICHYVGDSPVEHSHAVVKYLLRLAGFGWCGVDLFFVLSGFLIGSILLSFRDSTSYYRTFYLRRIHRIFPLYYVWILLFSFGIVGARWIFSQSWVSSDDLRHLPRYLFFVQNVFWNKTYGEFIWFGATWSLAVEEQFYLCIPFLVRMVPERVLFRVLIAVIVLAPLSRLLVLASANYSYLASLAMPFRADSLAMGVLGALLWKQNRTRTFLQRKPEVLRSTCLGFAGLVVALLYSFTRPGSYLAKTVGYSALAFLFLSLLLWLLAQPNSSLSAIARSKPLCWLGKVSYCVYIVHSAVLRALSYAFLGNWPRITEAKGALVTAASLVTTFIIAGISWRLLEGPMIHRGHRYRY